MIRINLSHFRNVTLYFQSFEPVEHRTKNISNGKMTYLILKMWQTGWLSKRKSLYVALKCINNWRISLQMPLFIQRFLKWQYFENNFCIISRIRGNLYFQLSVNLPKGSVNKTPTINNLFEQIKPKVVLLNLRSFIHDSVI